MKKFLSTKKYLTKDIENEMKLYSLDRNNDTTQLIGSMSYKTVGASDVDLFETISKDSKNKLVAFTKNNIQRIVKNLNSKKKQYFLEVKLGLNPLFSGLNIGHCASNSYVVDNSFFTLMEKYRRIRLISNGEYVALHQIEAKMNKNQHDYELVHSIIRGYNILRWTADEIKKGFKVLRDINGKSYNKTIELSLLDKSPINIEGIFINSDGKYIECSNYFRLEYNGQLLNLPDALNTNFENYMGEQLKESMYKLMYSAFEPNLFKSIKRMVSYSRIFNNLSLLEKVYPIINSQLGVLYNLCSQLKTISKIIKKHGSRYLNKTALYHTLDSIRFRFQDLIFIDYPKSNELIELINLVLSNEKITESELYYALDDITHNMIEFINIDSKNILQKIGLYPLPASLLPKMKPF